MIFIGCLIGFVGILPGLCFFAFSKRQFFLAFYIAIIYVFSIFAFSSWVQASCGGCVPFTVGGIHYGCPDNEDNETK